MTNFFQKDGAYSYDYPQQFNKPLVLGVATGLTATGTTITDALQLTAPVNNVTTAAASTGVKLPQSLDVGSVVAVKNLGANAVLVYPALGTQAINALANGAGFSIASGGSAEFYVVSATKLVTI